MSHPKALLYAWPWHACQRNRTILIELWVRFRVAFVDLRGLDLSDGSLEWRKTFGGLEAGLNPPWISADLEHLWSNYTHRRTHTLTLMRKHTLHICKHHFSGFCATDSLFESLEILYMYIFLYGFERLFAMSGPDLIITWSRPCAVFFTEDSFGSKRHTIW